MVFFLEIVQEAIKYDNKHRLVTFKITSELITNTFKKSLAKKSYSSPNVIIKRKKEAFKNSVISKLNKLNGK